MRSKLIAPVLAAGALAALPAAAQAQSLFNYFAQDTGSAFVSPSGKPLKGNARIVVGDRFLATDKLYPGSSKQHAKQFTGTAALSCLVTSVKGNSARAFCTGALSFGSSMLLSTSNQTFGPNGGLTTFPINGGTGNYNHSRGTLHVTPVSQKSNDDNFVIELR